MRYGEHIHHAEQCQCDPISSSGNQGHGIRTSPATIEHDCAMVDSLEIVDLLSIVFLVSLAFGEHPLTIFAETGLTSTSQTENTCLLDSNRTQRLRLRLIWVWLRTADCSCTCLLNEPSMPHVGRGVDPRCTATDEGNGFTDQLLRANFKGNISFSCGPPPCRRVQANT